MSPKTALVNHAPDPVHTLEPLGVPMRRLGAILRQRAWLVLLVLALGLGGMGGYLAWAPVHLQGRGFGAGGAAPNPGE